MRYYRALGITVLVPITAALLLTGVGCGGGAGGRGADPGRVARGSPVGRFNAALNEFFDTVEELGDLENRGLAYTDGGRSFENARDEREFLRGHIKHLPAAIAVRKKSVAAIRKMIKHGARLPLGEEDRRRLGRMLGLLKRNMDLIIEFSEKARRPGADVDGITDEFVRRAHEVVKELDRTPEEIKKEWSDLLKRLEAIGIEDMGMVSPY